jgi:hypothetical protein
VPVSVTLEQILNLSGKLDDSPGFDSARERFRRFLLEHASDLAGARALIEQGQHLPGEQHNRALQDLVVLLGRFIGFDVAFGAYAPAPGAIKHHGHWKSRLRLHVVIDVRSDPSAPPEVDALLKSVAAQAGSSRASTWRHAGLCVVTPLFASRHKIEEAIAAAKPGFPVGVVALRALMQLADLVNAGRVSHEDVARLMESNLPVEYSVELLDRLTVKPRAAAPARTSAAPDEPSHDDATSYWIATVISDYATSPEQLLELVIGRRHIFGVADSGTTSSKARSGDWICFYIAGKGVVGRARVQSLASGNAGIRDAHRFRQLLHLEDLELHIHTPVSLDFETQLRLRTATAGAPRQTQTIVRISAESFATMTESRNQKRA